MDSSYIGHFGTLSVMKTSDPTVPVAHFPIDEEEITIGRDPNCSIRLYYETVSRLHCKIIFQERKAFLVVLGASGVTTDGCAIFPTASGPTTIPLGNDTEVEVHRKRFRFTYPPKELRAIILPSPESDPTRRRKTLRMSMIHSAQVFSPGPSHDPQENLRTLQSPIKPRFVSPLKPSYNAPAIVADEEDVILVDGNHPSVVQDEDEDLVILETVQATAAHTKNPTRVVQFSRQPQQYQTPRRKPRSSLHRAVLIRSAQRVAMNIELETEEAKEEMEVEEVVAAIEDEPVAEELGTLHEDDWTEHEQGDPPDEDTRRQLGDFMTPQAVRGRSADVGHDRLGYSVEGPRRVRVVQPWKVQDIIIPEDVGAKKGGFIPVFRKERISNEERQAIRDRRKSALTAPDPVDSQIPGARRMSSVVPPSPTVFFSPTKGVFGATEDSKTEVGEENTTVLFEKMKAMVEDIKRRKSIGVSLSPTKQDPEAAFWGSGSQDVAGVEEEDKGQHEALLKEDRPDTLPTECDEELGSDNADEDEVERQTTPVHDVPSLALLTKTPRMENTRPMTAKSRQPETPAFGGMKHLFTRDDHATPAYEGIKDMFRSNKSKVTPKMDGLRDMFFVREEGSSLAFEGVGELLVTPVGYRVNNQQDPVDVPVDVEEELQAGDLESNNGAIVRKRKGRPVGKRTEAVSPERHGRQRVSRNIKATSKVVEVVTTLPRTTRTRKAMTEEDATTNKAPPRSEPLRKSKFVDVDVDGMITGGRPPTRKASEVALVQEAHVARPTRARPTRAANQDSGSDDDNEKAVKSKPLPARNGKRVRQIRVEDAPMKEDDVAKQSAPAGAKVKAGARGKRAEAVKDEDDVPTLPAADDHTTKKRAPGRPKASSKTPDNSSGREEKENTPDAQPDDDENEPTENTAPPPPAPMKITRTRKGVVRTPAVKDEPRETKIIPQTRVTRSKK